MAEAAGVIFCTAAGEVLLVRRAAASEHGGEWAFPGGHIEDGETAAEAAARECGEEIGHEPDTSTLRKLLALTAEGVTFTSFVAKVPEPFPVTLNDEHDGYVWTRPDDTSVTLHPGAMTALRYMAATETDVAGMIADGTLPSPQHFANVWLFALRVTGTGASRRSNPQEFCWRDPAHYLNPAFLARCNGLPVIWEHPEKSRLNGEEYANRTVGAICLPFIRGDEVWGVARIYDEDAAKIMTSDQWSTSPGVVFLDPTVNTTVTMEGGDPLLIEGKPALLDHLAICEQGVWDKGGEPAGVDITGVINMAEEKPATAAEADRNDAARWDAVMARLDAMASRMDALDVARKDATVEEKARADAAEAEEKARKDAAEAKEREDAARKDAEELKARMDALEKGEDRSDADEAEMADAQSKCDAVMSAHGRRAPAPMRGERPLAYRRRLARELQPHSAAWKAVDLSALPAEALAIAEGQIRADALKAAHDPSSIPANELRERTRQSPSGHTITEFQGDPSAWMGSFKVQPQRLARINKAA